MFVPIWSDAMEEMRAFGRAKSIKNPVSWGVVIAIHVMMMQVLHCMLNNCSRFGFTFHEVTVFTARIGIIYFEIPVITLGMKLVKHFIHKIFNQLLVHLPLLPNFVATLFQVTVSFVLAIRMYKTLDNMTVASRCLRARICTESSGFLVPQKLTENVCGESKLCFEWMVNIYWLLSFIFEFGFNLILESLWVTEVDEQPMRNVQSVAKSEERIIKEDETPIVSKPGTTKGKSVDPSSLNYVPNWHCPRPECPNHSVDYLPRLQDGMIGEHWHCRNEECDQHGFKKSDCDQKR